jgi:hypothetical protein
MAGTASMTAAHPLLDWLKMSPVGVFVRDTVWAFPTLQSLHFIGMCMLVGVVGAIDLRVLGAARGLPIHPLHKLLPVAFIGFGINLITGFFFFCHDPYVYSFNIAFRLKMLFIVVAGLNALWFQFGAFADVDKWGAGADASRLAKFISALSLFIWFAIITAGRFIAFVPSK